MLTNHIQIQFLHPKNKKLEIDPSMTLLKQMSMWISTNTKLSVASGGIDAVVESETHDNVRNAVDAAIHSTGNGEIDAGDAVEATTATANSNIDSTNTTGVINRTNTTEMIVAGVTSAVVNANINQDKEGAVDALVQVSVHMHTLFYIFNLLQFLLTNNKNYSILIFRQL
jgi:hypothetical protein